MAGDTPAVTHKRARSDDGTSDRREDCPVCFHELRPTDPRCPNNHVTCALCYPQVAICPQCRAPLPRIAPVPAPVPVAEADPITARAKQRFRMLGGVLPDSTTWSVHELDAVSNIIEQRPQDGYQPITPESLCRMITAIRGLSRCAVIETVGNCGSWTESSLRVLGFKLTYTGGRPVRWFAVVSLARSSSRAH